MKQIQKAKNTPNKISNHFLQAAPIAGNTGREIEAKSGKKIVSPLNAKKLKSKNEIKKLGN
jgi:hypothetical protein